jgi:hypothetical protein
MKTEKKKKIRPSNIAAIKAVATKIPAGAWAVIGIVFVVVLLVLFLATAFGIFFSGGTDGEVPIREAVADIIGDFDGGNPVPTLHRTSYFYFANQIHVLYNKYRSLD